MSNDEFSSVEWLYNKMVIKLCNKLQTIEYTHIFLEEFEQAKAMHKEEIEEAFANGVDDEYEYHINNEPRKNTEQYYKETFNND